MERNRVAALPVLDPGGLGPGTMQCMGGEGGGGEGWGDCGVGGECLTWKRVKIPQPGRGYCVAT